MPRIGYEASSQYQGPPPSSSIDRGVPPQRQVNQLALEEPPTIDPYTALQQQMTNLIHICEANQKRLSDWDQLMTPPEDSAPPQIGVLELNTVHTSENQSLEHSTSATLEATTNLMAAYTPTPSGEVDVTDLPTPPLSTGDHTGEPETTDLPAPALSIDVHMPNKAPLPTKADMAPVVSHALHTTGEGSPAQGAPWGKPVSFPSISDTLACLPLPSRLTMTCLVTLLLLSCALTQTTQYQLCGGRRSGSFLAHPTIPTCDSQRLYSGSQGEHGMRLHVTKVDVFVPRVNPRVVPAFSCRVRTQTTCTHTSFFRGKGLLKDIVDEYPISPPLCNTYAESLAFSIPGTCELTTASPQVDSNHRVNPEYQIHGTWVSTTGPQHVQIIPTTGLVNITPPHFVFSASAVFHSHANNVLFSIMLLREAISRFDNPHHSFHRLVNYTADMSLDPAALRESIAGAGEAAQCTIAAFGEATGHYVEHLVTGTGSVLHSFLSGPLKLVVNIVVVLLIIITILALLYLLYHCPRLRRWILTPEPLPSLMSFVIFPPSNHRVTNRRTANGTLFRHRPRQPNFKQNRRQKTHQAQARSHHDHHQDTAPGTAQRPHPRGQDHCHDNQGYSRDALNHQQHVYSTLLNHYVDASKPPPPLPRQSRGRDYRGRGRCNGRRPQQHHRPQQQHHREGGRGRQQEGRRNFYCYLFRRAVSRRVLSFLSFLSSTVYTLIVYNCYVM